MKSYLKSYLHTICRAPLLARAQSPGKLFARHGGGNTGRLSMIDLPRHHVD
jgi:hypothetical protein